MWHPVHLNIHIEHLATDIGGSHSGKVALELRKFKDRFFKLGIPTGKSALSLVGSGSRISQVLNAEGWTFLDFLIDWSIPRKLQTNHHAGKTEVGFVLYSMRKVIFQITVPSKIQGLSTRNNSPLHPTWLTPSTHWSHTKLHCGQDSLLGD